MANYQYKCVQVPESFEIGKKQSHFEVVGAYQDIINSEAKDGWKYIGIDTIESEFKGGCLSTIPVISWFVRGDEAINLKMLVFEKTV